MEKKVYINRIASYLPNKPISNDEMEDYIGMIGGKPSRVRSIVLRQREFDIKEWHNTLVISVFYFPHSVFQTLILLSDGFLSTSEAQ
ncbi:hypothetical protein [Porphyromonas gingivalis]|uniref:hypothetical protein n=1 Tax=Porphyromonas gingivalis TaxID=837 RepID=UPI001E4AD18A